MVSADLPSIGNASGHPVKWSIIVRMCFCQTWGFAFGDQIYGNLVKRTFWDFCHLERVSLNFWFLSVPCSLLSSSKVISLRNKSALILALLVYYVLLPILCISMCWGSQEWIIFGVCLLHVWKGVLLHVQKDQPCALVLFHLTVPLKFVCRSIFCICRSLYSIRWQGLWCSVSCVSDYWCCGVHLWCGISRRVLLSSPAPGVADSMLIIVGLFQGNSTRCDRQSATLLWASDIHLKVLLHMANSSPHLLTLLFVFFPLRNLASGLQSFLTVTSAPWR